jgi:hypothetical protein
VISRITAHFAENWYDDVQIWTPAFPVEGTLMNPTRILKIEGLEEARQVTRRQDNLPSDELLTQKLIDLQTFIRQLRQTDTGKADLQRRVQLFGDCAPVSGESNRRFYGKLRRWLDRDFEKF